MNRKKKFALTTLTAIINQIVTLACGLILPPLIIRQYGSITNGLISSITQFLAFFSMMEFGIGATVRASLYLPLANKDFDEVSRVLISSRNFFRGLGFILCIYCIGLMIYFPLGVDHSLGYASTVLLVAAISFSMLSNYLFGIVYQQLLNADQKSYIQLASSMVTTILNTIISVILINSGYSIEIVKLASSIVLLLRPTVLKAYVDRHYHLDFHLKLTTEPIKQKWNGLAQHIATHILKHVDVVILTWFSTLTNVSIYYVYHLVCNGLVTMVEVLTTGMSSVLGELYAREDREKLNMTFSTFELSIHIIVTFLFTVASIMIIPFIRIYTKNISDANYIVPTFAYLIVAANAAYCLRMPYYIMVQNAGHFKETQNSAFIEAILNVVISIVLVWNYGLVGVAFGTLFAMAYRTVYLVIYLKKHIIYRKPFYFVKHLLIDLCCFTITFTACKLLSVTSNISVDGWLNWILSAAVVAFTSMMTILILTLVFYENEIKNILLILFKNWRTAK